ncbi:MAG: hypothetical protein FWD73_08400 [Polyangiaceae bacterium]|nr:hypothetical protein [Polyangiaceae bacterium]
MAESVVEKLGRELEAIDGEYARDFAGHSRATRDLVQIDRMIERATAILAEVDEIPVAARSQELGGIRDTATQTLSLFRTEREAIERARNAGASFDKFAAEGNSANLIFARYARHFAGKDRSSRDLAMLGELVEDLKQIDKRMSSILLEGKGRKNADFERDRQTVRDNLAQYQREIDLIEKAQAGSNPEESAGILAGLANTQFAVYQVHFAGEPRVSRRPALLMRVVASLKKVLFRMTALREKGLVAEFHTKNIDIVTDRLKTYENELAEVRKIRQGTAMTTIMGDLGTAANKLFEEYRANFADKPRTNVEPERLGNICDKLGEIRRQMIEMSWAEDNEMNAKNLDIVNNQLSMFESEYEAVVRAHTANAANA